jgi:hypothetical protein
MVRNLIGACVLMAICVTIHAAGLTWALRRLRRQQASTRFWRNLGLFITVAVWIVLLHLSEVFVWAVMYAWEGALPNLPTAVYFSGVTYTTTGYGDVVLPVEWRLNGAVEALTGILMCGWSTGFFFTIVNRMYETRPAALPS